MDRLQELLPRLQIISVTQQQLTKIATVTPLALLRPLPITLVLPQLLIMTDMVTPQVQAGQTLTTLVIPEQIIMILMVVLQVLLTVVLTILELQEQLIRILAEIPGDRQHRRQTTLELPPQTTIATTLKMISGHGKTTRVSNGKT